MVGAGMGVSIVPEMAIEKHSPCRYIPIADEQASRTIGTVVLRGRSQSRALNAFLGHLQAIKESLAYDSFEFISIAKVEGPIFLKGDERPETWVDLVEPMGFESTSDMKTKEFCGATWPSK
jgi:hypothetical protein